MAPPYPTLFSQGYLGWVLSATISDQVPISGTDSLINRLLDTVYQWFGYYGIIEKQLTWFSFQTVRLVEEMSS